MDQTWIEVDIAAILHNVKEARKRLSPGVKICAIIKDNAYGHGLLPVAKALQKSGVEWLGIGDIYEAILLRKNGIKIPLLNIVSASLSSAGDIVKYGISQSVSNMELLKVLSAAAVKQKKMARVHIEIDTGMGRLGVFASKFEEFLEKALRLPGIKLEGVFSHLASADSNLDYTLTQISDFEYNSYAVKEGVVKHLLNSPGIINFAGAGFDMVRPGIMIYGLNNTEEENSIVNLKPALSWKTKVLSVKHFKKGSSISYGNTYRVKKNTNIAVLAVGYGDGYNRLLSNKGVVAIKGRRYPVVGRVCMDLTMVDLGTNTKVKAGDIAVLIGKSGKVEVSAWKLAELCGTITYEIVCAINKDVKRIYK